MHWYKRNIGDYAKRAGRLSMLQHGAYTQLIDACYDREQFPTEEESIEWLWASSPEEIAAVKFVLSRFFNLDQDGRYINEDIQADIIAYHQTADKNRQIAIAREANRRSSGTNRAFDSTKRAHSVLSGAVIVNEAPPNQEPITKNQEPSIIKAACADDRFERFWAVYPKKRGKDAALAAWKKRKPDEATTQKILIAISEQSASQDWIKEGGQYIPNPATWLNQGRWKDEGSNHASMISQLIPGAI